MRLGHNSALTRTPHPRAALILLPHTPRTHDRPELPSLQDRQQFDECPIQHRRRIAARNLVSQQFLRLAHPGVHGRIGRELDAPAGWSERLDDRSGRGRGRGLAHRRGRGRGHRNVVTRIGQQLLLSPDARCTWTRIRKLSRSERNIRLRRPFRQEDFDLAAGAIPRLHQQFRAGLRIQVGSEHQEPGNVDRSVAQVFVGCRKLSEDPRALNALVGGTLRNVQVQRAVLEHGTITSSR
ncbi:MAG TPA: hypothetical protein VF720_04680 [Candidatus Eisenbacteria bacterium]